LTEPSISIYDEVSIAGIEGKVVMSTVANVKRTSGKNMGNVKRENRSLLLTQLYFKGKKSRTSLAKELQLTPASITQTINNMIDEEIVVDTDEFELSMRMGRRQQFIDLNYAHLHAIGVTITNTQVRICITDLHFSCLYEDILDLDSGGAPQYARIICDKIAFGLYSIKKTKEEIIGIGVTIRGNVDSEKGVSEDSFGLLPKHTQIRNDIEQRIGIPVVVDNHIRSLMICEALYSRTYMQNTLFIKYGPGIGSAITVNGQLYTGGHSMAGEIGHMVLDVHGEVCRCGKTGCLETLSSFRAMNSKLAHLHCKNMGDIISFYDSHNQETVEVVHESVRHLLLAISNMAVLFDPKDIILYGDIFDSKPFLENFQTMIETQRPELSHRLHVSQHNALLDTYMASSLAIHAFLESGAIGKETPIAETKPSIS
jgi:predicted NBD/HSP70 family sugar kinase